MATKEPKGFCSRQTQKEWRDFFDNAAGSIRLVLLETGVDGGALLSQVQSAAALFRGRVSVKVINILECTSILRTFQVDAIPAVLVFWGSGLVERWAGLKSSANLASQIASRLSNILTRAGGERPALPQPSLPAPAPARPAFPSAPTGEAGEIQRLLALVNQARQSSGLQPLQLDPRLSRSANAHAADMAARRFYAHVNPEGEGPAERQNRIAPLQWRAIGENVDKDDPNADSVFRSWMASPNHRVNILRPNFTHIGLGVHMPSKHWVQVFAQL